MAVKVYTPGQFYAAGGVVEEMFYQEVGRTKKYLRKRVGFVRSFEQVIKNLNDEAWRKFHYMKANYGCSYKIHGIIITSTNSFVSDSYCVYSLIPKRLFQVYISKT